MLKAISSRLVDVGSDFFRFKPIDKDTSQLISR